MKKISKKINYFTWFCISLLIISTFTLCFNKSYALSDNISLHDINPLNRGSNYKHFDLRKYIQHASTLNQLVDIEYVGGSFAKIINSEKFISFLQKEIRAMIAQIDLFKYRINDYSIKINYRFNSDKNCCFMDVVWGIPQKNYWYFDQIKLFIK